MIAVKGMPPPLKSSPEILALASEIRGRISQLPSPNTEAVRAVRREFSRRIITTPPQTVIRLAATLIEEDSGLLRFFAYEIIRGHKSAWEQLTTAHLFSLGRGLHDWSAVDSFAMYLSGPMWADGRLPDETVLTWARSEDRWWRRTAVVSTVALSRRGNIADLQRTAQLCSLLVADRDDMIVKALSWALREVAKKHPRQARTFLATHQQTLAPRVIREVDHKLKTGLKTPRRIVKKA